LEVYALIEAESYASENLRGCTFTKGRATKGAAPLLESPFTRQLTKAATTLELYYTAVTFFSKGLQHDLSKLLRNVKEPCSLKYNT
jgi:hypothetical protein